MSCEQDKEGSASLPSGAIAIGRERLLGVAGICELTELGKVTASKLLKETRRCIRIHRRLFVLESSFLDWLHELERTSPCLR